MKKNSGFIRVLLIAGLAVLVMFFVWTGFLWKVFKNSFAGSYPHVETWSFDVREEELIKIIKEIKTEHPELQPPDEKELTSGRNRYWYDITFYYTDTKENVYTWTRENDNLFSTTMALVALTSYTNSPTTGLSWDRKEINSDYSYFDNQKELSKFDRTIVDLIREKIRQRH